MGLGHMKSASAVLAAAKECDDLGESVFLEKYGFAQTRYVAVVNDTRYPAKALVAVAHGIEFPDEGPLTSGSISGGWGGTNRVLRRLGFDVIDIRAELVPEVDGLRIWIELSRTKRQDRLEGPYKLGSALWSPKKDATGGDLYRWMREAQPGDWVLHLANTKAIVGRSRVATPVEDLPDPPPNTEWSDRECQLVRLRDFESFDPPFAREMFLEGPSGERLRQLKEDGLRNVFFTRNVQLAQGHYFTSVPGSVLHVLSDAFHEAFGKELIPGYVPESTDDDIVGESMTGLDELMEWTYLSRASLEEMISLLREKKQLILFGPPGSGKTFVADALARHLSGNPIDPEVGDLNDRYELVQFHQSYGYEDFIQGIRPVVGESGLSYKVQDGILKLLRDKAAEDPDGAPFVMLVDEINRGNLSRIFGELLLLLEYRGGDKQVRLPYADPDEPRFTLPENLYFIGTMNTADRSLAQIDYALRRRFFFYRLAPVEDGRAPVLEAWLREQEPVLAEPQVAEVLRLFVALNQAVTRELGEDFQIGHSYFMNHHVLTPGGRDRIWRTSIEPLLDEYFQNRKNRAQLIESLKPVALLGSPAGAEAEEPAAEEGA